MSTSSLGSNMLANQSNLMKPKEFLRKLKKSNNGQYFVNTKEWRKGIEICFNTFGLTQFLSEDYSIKVPKEQQWECVFEKDAQATVRASKKVVLREKNEQVKQEKAESGENHSPKKARAQTTQSALDSLDNRQAKYEEIVRQNAMRLAKKQKAATTNKARELTSFVDPLSALPKDIRWLNPEATVCVEVEGGDQTFYVVESNEARALRMNAWHLMIWTFPEMDKSVYEGMDVGDVYGLYQQVTTYLSKGKLAKESLDREFKQFNYKDGELFKTFVMRYKQLMREMDEVGLVLDDDLVRTKLGDVLSSAKNADVQKVYLNVLTMPDSERLAPTAILDAMQRQMTVLEKHAHRHEGDESEESEEERRTEQRRERRKQKKMGPQTDAATRNRQSQIGFKAQRQRN